MKIVILDGYTINPGDNPWEQLATLGELIVYDRTAPELVLERARDAEILLTNKTVLDARTLEALPRLRFVSVLATGYNVVDVAAAGRLGIAVSNVPGYSTMSVAQHVFAMLLELTNRVGLHDAAVQGGEWAVCPDFAFWKRPLLELSGQTLGIVGYGCIGKAVAAIGKAFGMRIMVYAPRPPRFEEDQAAAFVALENLFAESDVVSLHCPQTAENTGFINRALLERMKSGAFLINTARGALVHEQDLADALHAGVLAGAALDVVSREPIESDNPLLGARNCIITPHIAWASLAARKRLSALTAANVSSFLTGVPINVVNAHFVVTA